MRMAMIAITTKSSISVNARRRDKPERMGEPPSELGKRRTIGNGRESPRGTGHRRDQPEA